MDARRPLAVSMGEPAGIGPDIIIDAWNQRRRRSLPPFAVVGDGKVLKARAESLGVSLQIAETDTPAIRQDDPDRLAVVATEAAMSSGAGSIDPSSAPAVIEAIEKGAGGAMDGMFAGLVTCPIHKKSLYEAGFAAPGHTEFLGELASRRTGRPVRAVMMLAGPRLRAVPVTVHMPLAQVGETLTTDLIVETGRIVAADLARWFDIASPRLAVAGLNPHAGEGGALGGEDEAIVAPAVAALQRTGIDAVGPLPADTMFHDAARSTYDAALCMYHDQALIPAKALDFDRTVNVTLGLPFVRTSPDHGTALDIAGSGKARSDSFIAALEMAWAMSATRTTTGAPQSGVAEPGK